MLEKDERESPLCGARIKWRRICAVAGCIGLLVGLQRNLWHNFTHSAWDDLNSLIASWIGSDALISHESNSVLNPLVNQYASARGMQSLCSVLGASCFTLATLSDMMGLSMQMRWAIRAAKFLNWSRRLGFLGSFEFAIEDFVVFFLGGLGWLGWSTILISEVTLNEM